MLRRTLTVQDRKGGSPAWINAHRFSLNRSGDIMWIASLELNGREVVGRQKWPALSNLGREDQPHGFVLPDALAVGDFLEVRADRTWKASTVERRVWYWVVTDVGARDGLGRPKGPIMVEGTGPNLATPVLQRREEILALVTQDRSALMHRARKALQYLNPRERRQLLDEFERRR